ncbi:hypothetical protein PAERUG_P23_East_of_England_6_IMP_13_07_10_00255 [Pseudomonas aeruginosa]|nr:hypothetical protein PAERUG_P23_East_of_England_6_IMP_13_07_10_00255 [Pseudomonas aeruginosa]
MGLVGVVRLGLVAAHAVADIAGELDHLVELAVGVVDRVVAGFQPDRLAVAVDPAELPGDVLAAVQAAPEVGVLRAVAVARFAELTVVGAGQLGPAIAHGGEEVVVGREDIAVEVELDHRHRAGQGIQLALHLVFLVDDGIYVAGVLDHLEQSTLPVAYGIVGGFQPEWPALAGNALAAAGKVFAAPQAFPEAPVVFRLRVGAVAKLAMRFAEDLVAAVAQQGQEILIGIGDIAVRIELHARHGAVQGRHVQALGGELLLQVGVHLSVLASEHEKNPWIERGAHPCLRRRWAGVERVGRLYFFIERQKFVVILNG